MQYHFGLGVGHTYLPRPCNLGHISRENGGELEGDGDATCEVESTQVIQLIDGEVGDLDDIISDDNDSDLEVPDESDNEEAEEDDDEFLAMVEMHGFK